MQWYDHLKKDSERHANVAMVIALNKTVKWVHEKRGALALAHDDWPTVEKKTKG